MRGFLNVRSCVTALRIARIGEKCIARGRHGDLPFKIIRQGQDREEHKKCDCSQPVKEFFHHSAFSQHILFLTTTGALACEHLNHLEKVRAI